MEIICKVYLNNYLPPVSSPSRTCCQNQIGILALAFWHFQQRCSTYHLLTLKQGHDFIGFKSAAQNNVHVFLHDFESMKMPKCQFENAVFKI